MTVSYLGIPQQRLLSVNSLKKLDDPIARKLESLLCSFNMQLHLEETRNLKDTHLTSYFNKS